LPYGYVIGDIHGRFDLLQRAEAEIARHAGGSAHKIICLGDYVDRGPQSAQVLEHLIAAERERGVVCLKGNHEVMMLEACKDRGQALDRWLTYGGDATLASYGLGGLADKDFEAIPASHLAWIDGLSAIAFDTHRVYVHAGLMPDVAFDNQDEDTLLWIREKFLRAKADRFPDGKHIVHGHTPSWAGKTDMSTPELLPHRTNLDTGAYTTGVLTIGVFDTAIPGGPIETIAVA
jgi:serine/threonine protein phosphatase 1